MTRYGASVFDRISKDEGLMGQSFVESIDPPFRGQSAHVAIHRGGDDAVFLRKASSSFGHRCSKSSSATRLPDAVLTKPQWIADHAPNFKKWNVDVNPGVSRLSILDQHQVGAILCVARNGFDGRPFITIVGGPVITPVDTTEVSYHGAPDWQRIVGNSLARKFFRRNDSPSHTVLGSVASFSRMSVPTTMRELEDAIHPVMLTSADRFSDRVVTDSGDESGPFKSLFLPMHSDPAVGLWFPVEIGYQGFLDTIKGTKPYGALASLLEMQSDLFSAWFDAAVQNTADMVVTMHAVDELWAIFPTPHNFRARDTADVHRVAPLQLQKQMFQWQFFVDMVMNGPATGAEAEADRKELWSFLQLIDEIEPDVLGYAHRTAAALPFIPYLFSMNGNPRLVRLLQLFLDEDPKTQIPFEVRELGVTPLDSDSRPIGDDDSANSSVASDGLLDRSSRGVSPSPGAQESGVPDMRPHSMPRRRPPVPTTKSPGDGSVQVTGVKRPVTDDRIQGFESHRPSRGRRLDYEDTAGSSAVREDHQRSWPPHSQQFHGPHAHAQENGPYSADRGYGRQHSSVPASGSQYPPSNWGGQSSGPPFGPAGSQQGSFYSPSRGRSSWNDHSKSFHRGSDARGVSFPDSGTRSHGSAPPAPVTGQFWSPSKSQAHTSQGQSGWSTNSSYYGAYPPLTTRCDSMREASVATPEQCARCPIQWMVATLMSVTPITEHGRWWDRTAQRGITPHDYGLVREPTLFARETIFEAMEPSSKTDHTMFVSTVVSRYNFGNDFYGTTHLVPADLMALDASFIKKLFNVNMWQMRTAHPVSDMDHLHVLDFPRLLDPSLSRKTLPHGGYDIEFAQSVGKLVYYLFGLGGLEYTRDGHVQDRFFRNTAFGSTLHILCHAPFHQPLAKWWKENSRQATGLFIMDFLQLLELVSRFIQVRTGAGKAKAFSLLDLENHRDSPFVGTSVLFPAGFGSRRENFLTQLDRLKQDFIARWETPYYNGGEPMWSQPLPPFLFPSSRTFAKDSDSGTPLKKGPGKGKDKDKGKDRGDKVQTFTAKKPLFKFLKDCPPDQTPQLMLRDIAKVTDWVRMRKHDAKPRDGQKGMRQLCFCCAFESSETCEDWNNCRPHRKSSVPGKRLHIDLADTHLWNNYPKANWKPLVNFQREWHEWIQPTEALLAVCPDGDWQLKFPRTRPCRKYSKRDLVVAKDYIPSSQECCFRDVLSVVLNSKAARLFVEDDLKEIERVSPVLVQRLMPNDPQYLPDDRVVGFHDVALIVLRSGMSQLLDANDFRNLTIADPFLAQDNWHLLPAWVTRPVPPHLPRAFGFGIAEVGKSTAHDTPNPLMAVHFVWNFFTPEERKTVVQVHPSWNKYARLRAEAATTSLASLRVARPWIDEDDYPIELDSHQARLHSMTLLRFDFLHGDVIRWLGGEYTNSKRKYDEEWVPILQQLDRLRPPPELPPVNPIAAFRVQTSGVPLQAQFVTPSHIPAIRDKYDNHPAVAENVDKVEKKFAKEEWKCYHIHYHRWLYPFIYGVVINPIQWVFDKGKGRICIDCSNGPPDKRGSVNSHIPKPFNVKKPPKGMVLNIDECPPTFFKYAFKRVIRRILRMRATRPNTPILVHTDDIDAAFRRILYHPDLAIAFAYVFGEYLIIPVSQVFGGRSSPPFYGLLADVRELLAVVRRLDAPVNFHPLVQATTLAWDTSSPLETIPEDSHHPPLPDNEADLPFQASYVDDMATVAYPDTMAAAVDNSVKAAFAVFGEGDEDRRGACLQMKKWESEVSETFLFLGFEINTHTMTITWPLHKRQALHDEIVEILARSHPRFVSPKEMAHLVGVIRSASEIAPWGRFLSFNLQNSLTSAVRNAHNPRRRWYTRSRIYLSKTAVATLQQLVETLLCEDGVTWTRPMALFFDRDFTHRVYSDASYAGIGGWSADFSFMWRVTRDDLVHLGFNMKRIDRSSEPTADATGLHINPLEYVAALINLWLSLVAIIDAGPREGGYILQLNADNTTALAWMSEAARTPDPFLQGLARLGSALLVAAARLLTKVVPAHIPGVQNIAADALSRPAQEFVSWCETMCFTEYAVRELTNEQCIVVLGTYVSHVAAGWNCKRKTDLSSQSLRNYVRAAHRVLQVWLDRDIPIHDPSCMGKQQRYHEYISQQLSDRRSWSRKKPQKLPLTREIYEALAKHLASFGISLDVFLGDAYCVYDWLRLGVFTGFRVSEYAQAKVSKGCQFLAIPDTPDVPDDQRGQPLAFVATDFTFYTADLIEIPHSKVMAYHRRGLVQFVQLCWRFDKSVHNFVIRRYAVTGDDIFDPVDAAVNILYRAQLLKLPATSPLGAWKAPTVFFVIRRSLKL